VILDAQFDRSLVPAGQESVRHLRVRLRAPEETPSAALERPPLNLALVIDRSGSMQGQSLTCAARAAHGVVQALGVRDALSLVSFDDRIEVPVRSQRMDGVGQDRASRSILALTARGTTDLGEGWLTGAGCVADHAEVRPECHHHVVVLSDGYANRGITNPAELGTHAAALRHRGVSTSAVGIGADYSPEQLEVLAERGGGRLHHANRDEEIVEVVLGELGEVQETAVTDLRIRLTGVGAHGARCLSGLARDPVDGSWSLGALAAGRETEAVFRLQPPSRQMGSVFEVEVEVAWHLPGDSAEERRVLKAALQVVHEGDTALEPVDSAVALSAARALEADVVRQVTRLNRDGAFRQAVELLDHEVAWIREYVGHLEAGRNIQRNLRRLIRHARRPIRESVRKEMSVASMKQARMAGDHRQRAPRSWSDALE